MHHPPTRCKNWSDQNWGQIGLCKFSFWNCLPTCRKSWENLRQTADSWPWLSFTSEDPFLHIFATTIIMTYWLYHVIPTSIIFLIAFIWLSAPCCRCFRPALGRCSPSVVPSRAPSRVHGAVRCKMPLKRSTSSRRKKTAGVDQRSSAMETWDALGKVKGMNGMSQHSFS